MISVMRAGPASAISANITRNAAAVQITARTTTEPAARAVISDGHRNIANGSYATAAIASDAVTTPIDGRWESLRLTMIGPIA